MDQLFSPFLYFIEIPPLPLSDFVFTMDDCSTTRDLKKLFLGGFITTGLVLSYFPQVSFDSPFPPFLFREQIKSIILNTFFISLFSISKFFKIIKTKSSDGISVWTILLSSIASTSTVFNMFLLQYPYLRCCVTEVRKKKTSSR